MGRTQDKANALINPKSKSKSKTSKDKPPKVKSSKGEATKTIKKSAVRVKKTLSDDEDGDDSGAKRSWTPAQYRALRAAARSRALRKAALETGFTSHETLLKSATSRCDTPYEQKVAQAAVASGADAHSLLVSLGEVKRLTLNHPTYLSRGSYAPGGAAKRVQLSQERLLTSTATVLQARVDSLMKHMVNETVQQAVANGTSRVSAAMMHAAIAPFAQALEFHEAVAPPGVVAEMAVIAKSMSGKSDRAIDRLPRLLKPVNATPDADFQMFLENCKASDKEATNTLKAITLEKDAKKRARAEKSGKQAKETMSEGTSVAMEA